MCAYLARERANNTGRNRRRLMKLASRRRKFKGKNSGFALMEIMIAIGIIGAITAGVVTLASKAMNEFMLSKLTTNVTTVMIALQNTFQGQFILTSDTSDDIKSTLVEYGAVSVSDFENSLGGEMTLSFASVGGKNNRGALVSIDGVSVSDCQKLGKNLFDGVEFIQVASAAPTELVDASAAPTSGYLKTVNGKQEFSIDNVSTVCASVETSMMHFGVR